MRRSPKFWLTLATDVAPRGSPCLRMDPALSSDGSSFELKLKTVFNNLDWIEFLDETKTRRSWNYQRFKKSFPVKNLTEGFWRTLRTLKDPTVNIEIFTNVTLCFGLMFTIYNMFTKMFDLSTKCMNCPLKCKLFPIKHTILTNIMCVWWKKQIPATHGLVGFCATFTRNYHRRYV